MTFKPNLAFKRKLEELSQPRSVSLPDLMSPGFMRANTKFDDLQEMFNKSALADAEEEGTKGVLESEAWNAFVRANTKYSDWSEMLEAAAAEDFRNHFRDGGLS